MAMEITEILLFAQSPDGKVRSAAEETLKQFQEQNLSHYLLSLAVELSNDQKPAESRRLAGIILKNSLDAKDSYRKVELAQQWVSVDLSIKAKIKDSLLQTLGSSVMEARHTSSQVIAKIASVEIPRREWQDLIVRLLNNMKQKTAALKQATLEALGYVCEEVSYQYLKQAQVNAVLTAVVKGMTQQEHSCEVRLAAVRALCNALYFAQPNIRNEMDRNYVMKAVCKATLSKELEIRQAAFEFIVSIASMCYDVLHPYMDILFALTAYAVKGDEEPVALQAIEFWSAICDEEIERQETNDAEGNSDVPHSYFIQKALPSLGPMLLETLLKQEDQDQDDATWNLSMAGGTCLGLVARTVGDAVVPLVLPFVQDNITKPEWRNREAATFAFGSILEGPSVEKLLPIVRSGLDYLLKAMEDQNSHVKDTTAWTLGRIFEILQSPNSDYPVITAEKLPHIITVLMRSICDAPNVSEKVCRAIYFLAQAYEDAESDSSLLTPYLGNIISALLATADRMDTNGVRLRAAAYETLNEIVRCSKVPEASNVIAQLCLEIMNRLSKTIKHKIISSDDREKQSDLQTLLCGVLQVIVQKLSGHDQTRSIILQSADCMMGLFFQVLGCRSATVHEGAMLAIGSLAYATGPEFAKYMPEFYKYLDMGLRNFEEYQVCSISVGVVGDICRALDDNILPYHDGIMTNLLKDLSNPLLHRSVKPLIFSCFGDIALAIGEHFEKYIKCVLQMLQGAAEQCVTLDEDMLEYGRQLRRGTLEAYSGIVQGFKSKAQLILPDAASHILDLTDAIFRDHLNRDEGVTKAAVAVMGHLADMISPEIKLLFEKCMASVGKEESVDEEENIPWTKQEVVGQLLSCTMSCSLE